VEKQTKAIICIAQGCGKKHDFRLFKETTRIHKDILVKGDTGYQGMHHIHANCEIPKKETPLNKRRY